MKKLLYLGIVLMFASCGSDAIDSAASNESESAVSNESESAEDNTPEVKVCFDDAFGFMYERCSKIGQEIIGQNVTKNDGSYLYYFMSAPLDRSSICISVISEHKLEIISTDCGDPYDKQEQWKYIQWCDDPCNPVADDPTPITWSISSKPLENDNYEITLNGDIEEGWHTYGTTLPMSDKGPLGSWITFEESNNFELIDGIIEENTHSYYDETWDMDIVGFSGKAIFKQKIKVIASEEFILKGDINFMACKEGASFVQDASFEATIAP